MLIPKIKPTAKETGDAREQKTSLKSSRIKLYYTII